MGEENEVFISNNLRLVWLVDEPYATVRKFWNTLLGMGTPTRRTSIRGRASKRLEKRGWINIAPICDDKHTIDSLHQSAQKILNKLRTHALPLLSPREQKPKAPSIQMVLKPSKNLKARYAKNGSVPAVVAYVVLKSNKNPLATDKNEYNNTQLDWFTEKALEWMSWKLAYPPSRSFAQTLSDMVPPPEKNFPVDVLRDIALKSEQERDGDHKKLVFNTVGTELGLNNECPMCSCEIDKKSEDFVVLLCKHTYHPGCIRQWESTMRELATCPLCRGPLVLLSFHKAPQTFNAEICPDCNV